MGKGGDVDDDGGGDDDDHKDDDGDGGDGDGGGYNDTQVVRGVPEEQRLRGNRGNRAKPVGLSFQVRKLHCPGEIIINIIISTIIITIYIMTNSNKLSHIPINWSFFQRLGASVAISSWTSARR